MDRSTSSSSSTRRQTVPASPYLQEDSSRVRRPSESPPRARPLPVPAPTPLHLPSFSAARPPLPTPPERELPHEIEYAPAERLRFSTPSPSPPPEDDSYDTTPLLLTPPHEQPHDEPAEPARLRNVGDLSQKQCWICFGNEDPADPAPARWVHACRCSLVSHADCLLHWVESQQQQNADAPHCPVCNVPYQIDEKRSSFLAWYAHVQQRWDRASVVLALGSLAGGVWAASSVYACWAIRTFAGEDVASALLYRRRWPLAYFFNLPLIPATLILSRTPLIDSLLPFLPLTLVLSTSPGSTTSPLSSLSLSYPPSPALTLCLLPWARVVYLRLRKAAFDAALGRRRRFAGGLAGLMEEMQQDHDGVQDPGRDRIEVVAEIEVELDDAEQGVPPPDNVAGDNRLRVGIPRFTSLVMGALLFPAMCSAAGAALFYLASRSGSGALLLRKILGIQAVLAYAASTARYDRGGIGGAAASWIKSFATQSSPLPVAAVVDPVWVRNAIGGGLVLVIRDAFALVAGVLEQRRKDSRRVIGRPFDPSLELDGEIGAGTSSDRTSSGGVDPATGRPAAVHNLL